MGKNNSITSTTSNVRFYTTTGNMGNVRSGGSRFCYGPRRVFCFCLLAVITPSIFVSTVLLMRFVFNGTATYHINPSDMRILDHKISTTWCQSEKIKMNTTFTAFLTSGEPRLVKAPAPLTTTKTLIIPDDHKEYWGFYLLKGSTFRIRTCARHKGGTLLIVKGRSHLHHCAYIGEADSAGDSDEFSNSMSNENENDPGVTRGNSSSHRIRQQLESQTPGTSTEEITLILAKIRSFIRNRPTGYTRLKDNLSKWMLIDSLTSNQTNETASSSSMPVTPPVPVPETETTLTADTNSAVLRNEKNSPKIGITTSDSDSDVRVESESDREVELTATTPKSPLHHKIRHEHSRNRNRRHKHFESEDTANQNLRNKDIDTNILQQEARSRTRASTSLPTTKTSQIIEINTNRRHLKHETNKADSGLLQNHEHGTIRRHRRNVDVRKSTDSGENGAFEDSSEFRDQDYEFPPLDLNSVGRERSSIRENGKSQRSQSRNEVIPETDTETETETDTESETGVGYRSKFEQRQDSNVQRVRNKDSGKILPLSSSAGLENGENRYGINSSSSGSGSGSGSNWDSTATGEVGEVSANKTVKPPRRQDTPNSIWKKEHSHHTGTLNDTNPHPSIDGSDSESESSFSSSEEALAKCEGVVASLYLKATPNCGLNEDEGGDADGEDEIPIFYQDIVNASGYYYFIFGSENEKRDNFIRARFELDKFVYELPPPLDNCTDVTQCHVNLTFWSSQKLVVQIPQPTPEQESIWDEVYLAETECEPRVLLYLIFVVVVPISIILCAFQ